MSIRSTWFWFPATLCILKKKWWSKNRPKVDRPKVAGIGRFFKKKFTENYLTSNLVWPLSGFWMLHWSFWHIWIFDLRAQNKDFFKNPENQNFRFSAGKMVGREKYFLKKNLSLLYITKKILVWISCLMMKWEKRTFRCFFFSFTVTNTNVKLISI